MVSLWALFDQYPTMLVRRASQECMEFSHFVQLELGKKLRDTHQTSVDSFLLILDRGMDLKTPLMHDLAFQPLIYDLLPGNIDTHFYSSKKADDSSLKYQVSLIGGT